MGTYAIGDIHGCYAQFGQLMNLIEFKPGKDTLWLVGDLINRGPQSLEMLRWAMEHDDCVQMVLGNHELHLLAIAEGCGPQKPNAILDKILQAADSKILLDWLRCQPMMIIDGEYAMVHAGLMPEWSIRKALALAEEVEDVLTGPNFRLFMSQMYGNKPARWSDSLHGVDRWRIVVNAMTRMRFLNRDGSLDFSYKGTLADMPPTLTPWFDAPAPHRADYRVICGHWSALGVRLTDDVLSIDSGCLWGGQLTALRLEDQQVFSLQCPVSKQPDWE